MNKIFSLPLLAIVLLVLLTSCRERRDYYYTPTIDLNVSGGTSGGGNSPLQMSGSKYTPYEGGAYWGEEGKSSHYTPYDSKREKSYDYYRGTGD